MPYKMVTDSEKAAGKIAGTALAHAELIAADEAAHWQDQLTAGQGDVTVLQLQQFHARELLRRRDALLAAEKVHTAQLRAVTEIRERRDAARPKLREKLYEYRDLLKLTHGQEGARATFESDPTVPQDATPLRRVARIVIANLRDPKVTLPPARLPGGTFVRSEAAKDILGPLVEMEAAMQELEDELPKQSQTLEVKHKAHAALDKKLAAFARFIEALYVLEGHEVLAAKVRPSSHKVKKVDGLGKEADGAAKQVLGTGQQRSGSGEPATEPAPSAPSEPAGTALAARPAPVPPARSRAKRERRKDPGPIRTNELRRRDVATPMGVAAENRRRPGSETG